MNHSKTQGVLLILFIVIIIVYTAVLWFFLSEFERKYTDYVEYREEMFESSIRDIFGTYEEFSNFIFNSEINRESVLHIVAQASVADETKKNELRSRLYTQLQEVYEITQKYNFRQLHFHLPNGDSFLRFHSPAKYGDNLFEFRESIRIANEEKEYVTGFEEGRIFNGYRYVYPLSYEGVHIGSVEISVSMASLIHELSKNDAKRDLGFIIDRELVESVVFEEEQSRYGISTFSDHYLYDSEVFTLLNQVNSLKLYENKEFVAALKKEVKEDLETKESFSLSFLFDSNYYLVHFRAIKDIGGDPVGYLFSISESQYIKNLHRERMILFFIAFFTFAVVTLMFVITTRMQRKVHKIALTDQLTQIYNRFSFYEFARKEMAKQRRSDRNASLAMIDIDYFKKVNDAYGHITGDLTLKTLAQIILRSIRTYDIFARFGGEEFVLLLPETDVETAVSILERIRKNVEAYDFPQIGALTISIGITETEREEEIDTAINRADQALYQAKAAGRNKTEVYRETVSERVGEEEC